MHYLHCQFTAMCSSTPTPPPPICLQTNQSTNAQPVGQNTPRLHNAVSSPPKIPVLGDTNPFRSLAPPHHPRTSVCQPVATFLEFQPKPCTPFQSIPPPDLYYRLHIITNEPTVSQNTQKTHRAPMSPKKTVTPMGLAKKQNVTPVQR
jgi:hypothetical protein